MALTAESSIRRACWHNAYGFNTDGALTLGNLVMGSVSQAGDASVALLAGAGTSTTRVATATAGKNFLGFWTESSATSGDSRGLYIRHYLSGAGSGEAVRAYATAAASGVAAGGTINGIHASLSLNASASVSGQGFAGRFTLGAAADTRTINGNLAVINLDSDIATGNTVPSTVSFIKVTDTSNVTIPSFVTFPAVGNGLIVAAHTAQTNTHSIRIVCGTTTYYIPCHATATGRS